jgi:hypothetical protein
MAGILPADCGLSCGTSGCYDAIQRYCRHYYEDKTK